ncbi:MAG: hypothetical protein HOC27_05450 [Phycisphaerae bacterium]|jgi:hypothetical protein|nr:hypothetical protein [Phycisphaerae bacterium]
MAINMESPMNSSGIFFSTYHDVSIHMAITLLPDTVADLDAIQVAQLLQTAFLQITMRVVVLVQKYQVAMYI